MTTLWRIPRTLWDARPWTPELRVEQRALGLVRFLFEHQKLPREQVLDRITHDRSLTPEQRAKALEFARDWKITILNEPPK